ncbi:MAG: beta-glucosidase [Acidobacteriota bacterium]|nr:beta-glucosidase [Acidobacteriota bacterium]
MMRKSTFQSYLMGGFECSTHRNYTGKRLDVIAATRHEEFAEADYERLLSVGMRTARDGIRWHLIEREPFRYDFSSAVNQIRAARKTGIEIIWDLFHYGYPDDLDIFSEDFPVRFAAFAEAFIGFLSSEDSRVPFISPVNEISFYSWIAGQVGGFYPFARDRGDEMKRQLVRASIAAIDKIRLVRPEARFVQADPLINIIPESNLPEHISEAKNYHAAQYHSTDMLVGKSEPEIGGGEKYLDVVGVNYYSNNQWRQPGGGKIFLGDSDYRPFSEILLENYRRYNRPILIAETGIEGAARPEWFRYIFEQTEIAAANGVPIEGICLYPIVNHPGWDDDRHCLNGLWCYPDENGKREIYAPLAEEIQKQKIGFRMLRRAAHN